MIICVLISTLITLYYCNYSILTRTLNINLYMNLVGGDDKAVQPEEVVLEAKDEHKQDKVQILLEGEFYLYP